MNENREAIEAAVDAMLAEEAAASEQEIPAHQPEVSASATMSAPEDVGAESPVVTQQQPVTPEEDPVDKRFRGMQSLIDRKFNQLVEFMEARLAPQQPASQDEALPENMFAPEQQQAIDAQVQSILKRKLGLDPQTVAEMKLQAEVAAYRRDPNYEAEVTLYQPLVLKTVEKFPQMGIPINRQTLAWAHEITRAQVMSLMDMVNASRQQPTAGEAATAKKPAPQPTNGSRVVTPEARAVLQQQANALKPQTGVSLSGAPQRQPKNDREAIEMAMEKHGYTDSDF